MTRNEAYKILGVATTSGIDQIEEAYKTGLRKCQLQLVAGQPLSVRQDAQERIVNIEEAWQLLKNQTSRNSTSQPVNTHRTRVNYFGWHMPLGISPRTAGFFVALILMGSISALCMYSLGYETYVKNTETIKTYATNSAASEPMIASNPPKAHLRVLAVPWCYVEMDGRTLGASGQLAAFQVSEGNHTLVLRRNGKILTKNVLLQGAYLTVISVDFERGIILVERK